MLVCAFIAAPANLTRTACPSYFPQCSFFFPIHSTSCYFIVPKWIPDSFFMHWTKKRCYVLFRRKHRSLTMIAYPHRLQSAPHNRLGTQGHFHFRYLKNSAENKHNVFWEKCVPAGLLLFSTFIFLYIHIILLQISQICADANYVYFKNNHRSVKNIALF